MNIEHVVSEMSSFQFSGTRPASWQSAPDAWLHGYWAFGWADNHVKIASIDTANSRLSRLELLISVVPLQDIAICQG